MSDITITKRAPVKRKRSDHVICAPPNTFKCLHCGETLNISMPVRIEVFCAANEAFVKCHLDCVDREVQNANG